MEKTINIESKKNIKINENTYKLFSEEKIYELTLNKLTDEIEFILSIENNFENYKNIIHFTDIQKTQCFKLEENFEELYAALIHYICENKIRVFEKENFCVLVLESEFNGKKLKSELLLNSHIINETELIKILKAKVNFLLKENKIRDEKLEAINKENKDNADKINDLSKELVKIKDLINENKSINNNSKDIDVVKKKKQKKSSTKKIVSLENTLPKNINSLDYLEIKRSKYPLIKNFESKILSNEENEKLLFTEWFGKEFSMDLLYSSQLHGKDVSEFHNRCDGESNTLTLIKSDKGFRLGGFTYLKFSSENKFEKGDGNDFIFSLDKKKMFKNNKDHIYALYNNPNMFPTFGYPSDIYIHKTCFTSITASYSSFPSSYGVGLVSEGEKNTYFTGTYNFIVEMIEVFKINFD